MPQLTTSTDIFPTLAAAMPLSGALPAPYGSALATAFATASPVDQTVQAMEVLYAAAKSGALSGEPLVSAATSAGQTAFLVLSGRWHGKMQRAFDILDAMRKVVEEGAAPADAGGPEVDEQFQPKPEADTAPSAQAA